MSTAPNRRLSADDSAGPIKDIQLDKPQIEEVHDTDLHRLFADVAFMEERVLIVLHPGLDESEIGVPVSVNGDRVYIIPGRPTWVKRKHVGQLVKAKPDYVNHRQDSPDGPEAMMNRFQKRTTSRYNFDVEQDTPKGIAWLKEYRKRVTHR